MKEDNLKLLPKIEASFQNDFAGSPRELYLTPKYVLEQLGVAGIIPHIGDELFFWEKELSANSNSYCRCGVGEIVEATKDILKEYTNKGHKIMFNELVLLDGKPIVIKIKKDSFKIPSSSPIFKTDKPK